MSAASPDQRLWAAQIKPSPSCVVKTYFLVPQPPLRTVLFPSYRCEAGLQCGSLPTLGRGGNQAPRSQSLCNDSMAFAGFSPKPPVAILWYRKTTVIPRSFPDSREGQVTNPSVKEGHCRTREQQYHTILSPHIAGDFIASNHNASLGQYFLICNFH